MSTEIQETIERLRELDQTASPAPWSWSGGGQGSPILSANDAVGRLEYATEEDLDLITETRNAIPALLDERERLIAELERLTARVAELENKQGMTLNPVRVQRQHTKGWRMPDNAVYVGPSSIWESPYFIEREGKITWHLYGFGVYLTSFTSRTGMEARAEAVSRLQKLMDKDRAPWDEKMIRAELAGKNLVCWCPLDQSCHGDLLLEIANQTDKGNQ